MRKLVMFATAVAALAIPSIASADVPRYQTIEAGSTLTAKLDVHNFPHVFTIDSEINPCGDGAFTGTGYSDQGPYHITEKVKGTITDGKVAFTATYTNVQDLLPGYTWGTDASGPLDMMIAAHDSNNYNGGFNVSVASSGLKGSHYKNHGEYVKAMGGGADAAHSCIGMPIVSGK